MKILFDATILAEGLHKASNRSGIFWASYEIFRALDARNDVKLGIYSSPSLVDSVNAFMSECFPGRSYKVLNRERSCFLGPLRAYIEAKRERPANKVGIRKRFWQICGMMAKIARVLWDKYVGCARVAKIVEDYDVFFSPIYLAPRAIRRYSKKPRFTILYDTIPMIYPQFFPFAMLGFSWNFDLIKGLREDDHCFAISECTKRDFLHYSSHLRAENVTVIPLAAAERFHPETRQEELNRVRAKYGIPTGKRYVLSMCTIEPRKNLGFALEAFGRYLDESKAEDVVFVLGGGHWGHFESKWAAILDRLAPYREKIIYAGYIDDEDLAALYGGAEVFVYPSLYEGFGLPALEAMQCGTAVITSNVSSLPEVVAKAALTIDPHNLDAMSEALRRVLSDQGLRADLQIQGLARAREFSWEKTADIIVRTIYGKICKNSSSKRIEE